MLTGHTPGQLQGGDGSLPHLRPGFSLQKALGQKPCVGQLEVLFNRGFAPNIDNRFQTIVEFRDRISLLTASATSTQPEDPVAVAERASAILRQRDRTTQIREFQQPATKLLESLLQFAANFRAKLGRFNLIVSLGPVQGQDWPAGLDRICPSEFRLLLTPAHHNHARAALYAIGSCGEQCVVLRQKLGTKRGDNQLTPISAYEELLWYDATAEPKLEPIELDIRQWLNAAIQELTDMVVAE